MKKSFVYILKCSDDTFYTGVTSNLEKRIEEHARGDKPESYTSNRRPVKLVWYTEFSDITIAITREKQIKKWSKTKKQALNDGKYEDLPNLAKKNFK